jgi:GMP synthase (glutamine-hydrolysing)
MPRAIIFQHEEHEGPGLLGMALEEAGFTLETRLRQVRPGDEDAPLVVVLGGAMAVYEADRYPFLHQELSALRTRLSRGLPVLGVCLGSQLLASAAGAPVAAGREGFEVGALPVTFTAEAREDAVFGPAGPSLTVAHWHQDTFEPVSGAALLASTQRYPQQAFRLGPSYGLQFHLELTAEELWRWAQRLPHELAPAGVSLEEMRVHHVPALAQAEPSLRAAAARLAAHFARVCAG